MGGDATLGLNICVGPCLMLHLETVLLFMGITCVIRGGRGGLWESSHTILPLTYSAYTYPPPTSLPPPKLAGGIPGEPSPLGRLQGHQETL